MVPQAQRETAFHFLISNRLAFLDEDDVDAVEEDGTALPEASPAGTIVTSVSSEVIAESEPKRGERLQKSCDEGTWGLGRYFFNFSSCRHVLPKNESNADIMLELFLSK